MQIQNFDKVKSFIVETGPEVNLTVESVKKTNEALVVTVESSKVADLSFKLHLPVDTKRPKVGSGLTINMETGVVTNLTAEPAPKPAPATTSSRGCASYGDLRL